MSYIYLASPYSGTARERGMRYQAAMAAVAHFTTQQGLTVYSPIVMYHAVAENYRLDSSFEFWQKHNQNMLATAAALYILHLPGSDKSVGVAWEHGYAVARSIPVKHVNPETYGIALQREAR